MFCSEKKNNSLFIKLPCIFLSELLFYEYVPVNGSGHAAMLPPFNGTSTQYWDGMQNVLVNIQLSKQVTTKVYR